MNYRAHKKNLKGNFGIGIFREDGVHCYGTNIYIESGEKIDVKEYGCVEVRIENACCFLEDIFLTLQYTANMDIFMMILDVWQLFESHQ